MRYIVSNRYITIYFSISEVSLEILLSPVYNHANGREKEMDTQEAVANRIRQLCRAQGITPNKLGVFQKAAFSVDKFESALQDENPCQKRNKAC